MTLQFVQIKLNTLVDYQSSNQNTELSHHVMRYYEHRIELLQTENKHRSRIIGILCSKPTMATGKQYI